MLQYVQDSYLYDCLIRQALQCPLGEWHIAVLMLSVAQRIGSRPCVERFASLHKEHMALITEGHGAVHDTVGHDNHLALFTVNNTLGVILTKLHPHTAAHDKEALVLQLMVMPHKLALQLDDFELAFVDISGHVRRPGFRDTRKCVCEIDLAR